MTKIRIRTWHTFFAPPQGSTMALMAKDKRSTTMINYSIVMRSVNANLFDINQAKSRIKAAEKAGQTPSSEDVALVATERQNAFARRGQGQSDLGCQVC